MGNEKRRGCTDAKNREWDKKRNGRGEPLNTSDWPKECTCKKEREKEKKWRRKEEKFPKSKRRFLKNSIAVLGSLGTRRERRDEGMKKQVVIKIKKKLNERGGKRGEKNFSKREKCIKEEEENRRPVVYSIDDERPKTTMVAAFCIVEFSDDRKLKMGL